MASSRLTYDINKDYDALMVYEMIANNDSPDNARQRALEMDIPIEVVEGILTSETYQKAQPLIEPLVEHRYKDLETFAEQSRHWYQQSWNMINQPFFDRLEEITGFPPPYREYRCVVSLFHYGLSNWNGNTIVRRWKENPYTQRRTTAQEIIISYFFDYVRNRYPDCKDETGIWKLAEIFSIGITGTDKTMQTFWPWDTSGAYTEHGYETILTLQKELTPLLVTQGFNSFMKHAITTIAGQ